MHTPERLLLLSIAMWVAGCATSSLDLAPPAPNVPWTPKTGSDGEIVPGAPASSTTPRSTTYTLPPNAKAAGQAPAPEAIDLGSGHRSSTGRLRGAAGRDGHLTADANHGRGYRRAQNLARSDGSY